MKKQLVRQTRDHFQTLFHHEPEAVFLSPGRINIIGEHVDYNDGFVLPAAINKYVCFALRKTENDTITFFAKDLNESYALSVNDNLAPISTMWVNYLIGVLDELKRRNCVISGFEMVFSSTIPMGAGLSSSAAVECGLAYALNSLFELNLSKQDIALIGQQAEHRFAGVKCGIMDQFASVFGKKNKVIKLDCTTLDYMYYDAHLGDYSLLLLDSCVKHSHLTSGYNDRRNEVEVGLKIIQSHYTEVRTFRDCTLDMIENLKSELGEIIYQRCHFVVKEIARVDVAANALNSHQYALLGQTMTETHWGLSKEYEVSCPEIDFLVAKILQLDGVLGARMMGGGFGGCSINLVTKAQEKEIISAMKATYLEQFGITLKYYPIKISKGTSKYTKA
ncbi:MAG: Galactokinase [Bacteroidota bacterium]|jgi:galactokinase